MASKFRVPTADAVRQAGRTVVVEEGSTAGATVGVDLRLSDGTIVTAAQIINPISGPAEIYSPTVWKLIGEIPPNIVAVAALTGGGFAFMDSVGVWRVRRLGRQVINFSFGDASPATIWTTPHTLHVVLTRVVVLTPFNGAGASVKVGTVANDQLLFEPGAAELSQAAAWEFNSDAQLLSAESIKVTITPGSGASAGTGRIIIDSIPLEGI